LGLQSKVEAQNLVPRGHAFPNGETLSFLAAIHLIRTG